MIERGESLDIKISEKNKTIATQQQQILQLEIELSTINDFIDHLNESSAFVEWKHNKGK